MLLPHQPSLTGAYNNNKNDSNHKDTPMLPRSFRYPSVKQSLQDRTDIWRNVTI